MNNKIPPPIVTLIFGLGIYFSRNLFPNHDGLILDVFSVLLLICGIIIIRTAFLSFKNHQTTINPLNLTKTSSLVNTGIFKYTRNPMYLGMVLILLSIALKFNLYGGLIVIFLFFSFITKFQIIPEEKAMENLFGEKYKKYKTTTRRWL
jgi:protein-S-isoprenylcysteine O-methyltransferase Ste14